MGKRAQKKRMMKETSRSEGNLYLRVPMTSKQVDILIYDLRMGRDVGLQIPYPGRPGSDVMVTIHPLRRELYVQDKTTKKG